MKKYSNRLIKKILKILSNHGSNFDYKTTTILYDKLKNRHFSNFSELSEAIISAMDDLEIEIDSSFVVNTIYTQT